MMRNLAVSALLVGALGATAGTVNAAPAQPEAVAFTAAASETTTVVTTDAGSLAVEDGVFKVKATDGTVLTGTPLHFRLDEFVFPIAAEISGRTATLTPQLDPAKATYQPVALPYENQAPWRTEYEREQAAWQRLVTSITAGAAVGATVGGVGGAAVGCVLGGLAGATIAAATIVGLFGPFLPAAAIGCIGGVMAVGALGTIAGQLLVTAPIVIGAAIQYFTTINSPLPAK